MINIIIRVESQPHLALFRNIVRAFTANFFKHVYVISSILQLELKRLLAALGPLLHQKLNLQLAPSSEGTFSA